MENRHPPYSGGCREGAYFFGAGGLLPRPPPEGLPVLLGQFGLLLLMKLLLSFPR